MSPGPVHLSEQEAPDSASPTTWVRWYSHGRCNRCQVVYQWPSWRLPLHQARCQRCRDPLRRTSWQRADEIITVQEPT